MTEQIGDRGPMAERNAFEHSARTDQRTFDGDLTVEAGRCTNDVRNAPEFRDQIFPVGDAVLRSDFQNADVGGCAEQAGLQGALKAVVDSERNDQRRDSGGDTQDGNDRYHGDNGLFALGAKITKRDDPFEARHLRHGAQ